MNSVAALRVDWVRCQGHGVCSAAIGEVVSRDRWGYPEAVNGSWDVPPDLVRAARIAVATCPAVALRLVPPQQ